MKAYKIGLVIVILFAVASTIFAIWGPDILGRATTELFEGLMRKISGTGGIDFSKIGGILLFLICIYLISAFFSYIQGFIMSGISKKVTYQLRKEISEKINKLPLKYYDKTSTGEVLSRITNDVDTISQSLNQSITQLITSIVTLIGIFIMMIRISVPMTIVAVCILPFSFLLIMGVVVKSQKYFKAQQEYLGHLNGHIEEMYGSHTVVKAFNGEQKAIDQFEEYNNTLYSKNCQIFIKELL